MSQNTVAHEWGWCDTFGICVCRSSKQLGIPLESRGQESDYLEQNALYTTVFPGSVHLSFDQRVIPGFVT